MKLLKEISILIQIRKILNNMTMKNWKTSLTGLLTLIPTALHLFLPNVVSAESANQLTALFVSLGLFSAKDHNVTGGTIEQ